MIPRLSSAEPLGYALGLESDVASAEEDRQAQTWGRESSGKEEEVRPRRKPTGGRRNRTVSNVVATEHLPSTEAVFRGVGVASQLGLMLEGLLVRSHGEPRGTHGEPRGRAGLQKIATLAPHGEPRRSHGEPRTHGEPITEATETNVRNLTIL